MTTFLTCSIVCLKFLLFFTIPFLVIILLYLLFFLFVKIQLKKIHFHYCLFLYVYEKTIYRRICMKCCLFYQKEKKIYLILWNYGCYIDQGKQVLIYPCSVSFRLLEESRGCRNETYLFML